MPGIVINRFAMRGGPRNYRIRLLIMGWTLFSAGAHGQLAQNVTLGNAKAIALANAVTADPPGIDAIHFNPAGLALLANRQLQLKLVTGHYVIRDQVTRTPLLESLLAETEFEETLQPGATETSNTSAMLPFFGLTELPGLFATLGGVSVTSRDQQYTFATAVYSNQMVGFKRQENSIARYQGNELGFTHLTYFSPSFAMNLNEHWSVGVALVASYTGVGLDLDMRVTNEFLAAVEELGRFGCDQDQPRPIWNGVINLCEGKFGPFAPIGNLYFEAEDNFNPSLNFGILWQPTTWFSWGMVYQTEAETTLQGNYEFQYVSGWVDFFQGVNQSLIGSIISPILPQGIASEKGAMELDYVIPAHFSTGISLRVLPEWKLNFDVKWTDTAAWEKFNLRFSEPLDFLPILSFVSDNVTDTSLAFPLNYESTWSWALGVEYQYTDQLALRVGYEDRPSAASEDSSNLLIPIGDASLVGIGASYVAAELGEFDIAFGWLYSKTESNASRDRLTDSNEFYNPYAGYDLESEVNSYLLEFSYRGQF